jgi:hypothetical protein
MSEKNRHGSPNWPGGSKDGLLGERGTRRKGDFTRFCRFRLSRGLPAAFQRRHAEVVKSFAARDPRFDAAGRRDNLNRFNSAARPQFFD